MDEYNYLLRTIPVDDEAEQTERFAMPFEADEETLLETVLEVLHLPQSTRRDGVKRFVFHSGERGEFILHDNRMHEKIAVLTVDDGGIGDYDSDEEDFYGEDDD